MKGGGAKKNSIYESIINTISLRINNKLDAKNPKNDLTQYYHKGPKDKGPKKECGTFSNEECYSESTANDIQSIDNGIRIKDLIKEYILEINFDDIDDNDDRLYLLMKTILTTRESDFVSYLSDASQKFQVTDTLNQLIKIIVKVMKANYIKEIYENKDNYSKLLELNIKITSDNNKIREEPKFGDVSLNDILEILSIFKQKAELKKAAAEATIAEPEATKTTLETTKATLETTQAELEATQAEAAKPPGGGRKRRSRKKRIKRRGRKSRKQ